MTTSILSFGIFCFALALLAAVAVVTTAALAGPVLHTWGTNSTLEWLAEAFRRVFVGSLRRRLMHKVNCQSLVNVDGSRQTYPYLAVTIAPHDSASLTGPGGSLSAVANAAANGYLRHAKAQGWNSVSATRVVVVVDESLRRGNVRVRPVQRDEYLDLEKEMTSADQDVVILPEPLQGTAAQVESPVPTQLLAENGDATAPGEDPAFAMTMPAMCPRIVLSDDRGGEHAISAPSVLIGRSRECKVRLDSADVSREHLDLYFQEGTWWLRDRGSRNGTTIDGREVGGAGPVRVSPGNRIVLGGEKAGESLTIASLMEV